MELTAVMITTRGGTTFALDQRRRDALMTYAQQAADAAGTPRQTWCRKVWGLTDYEAKHLLKGDASEVVWERILKMRGSPHGGWRVALPVLGAVIGEDFEDHLQSERRRHADHVARTDALASDLAALNPFRRRLRGDVAAEPSDRRRSHGG